jgi:hypothetical protein
MIREPDRPEPEPAARRHYKITFALLALAAVSYALLQSLVVLGLLVGLAVPQRRPADAFAPHEAGDLKELTTGSPAG